MAGFARCRALVSRIVCPAATADSAGGHLDRARTSARLVQIAAARGFYRATCLPQSLVLWWLLKRQGMEAELRVGVRKGADRFEAHAWVEHGGVVLLDDADVHERYAAFDRALVR
jgi:Transglutaminase-like superfamily